MGRIKGESVLVSLRLWGETDGFHNEVEVYAEPEQVDNVLVGRSAQTARVGDGHQFGYESDISFSFPKGYERDLRGAKITRNGITYEIVGNPQPITEENIPAGIDWNIHARAVVVDG